VLRSSTRAATGGHSPPEHSDTQSPPGQFKAKRCLLRRCAAGEQRLATPNGSGTRIVSGRSVVREFGVIQACRITEPHPRKSAVERNQVVAELGAASRCARASCSLTRSVVRSSCLAAGCFNVGPPGDPPPRQQLVPWPIPINVRWFTEVQVPSASGSCGSSRGNERACSSPPSGGVLRSHQSGPPGSAGGGARLRASRAMASPEANPTGSKKKKKPGGTPGAVESHRTDGLPTWSCQGARIGPARAHRSQWSGRVDVRHARMVTTSPSISAQGRGATSPAGRK